MMRPLCLIGRHKWKRLPFVVLGSPADEYAVRCLRCSKVVHRREAQEKGPLMIINDPAKAAEQRMGAAVWCIVIMVVGVLAIAGLIIWQGWSLL